MWQRNWSVWMKVRCKICAVSSHPLRSTADFALMNLCSPLVLLFSLWPCAAMTTTGDAAHHMMSWPLLWQKRHSHWCTLARSHSGSHTLDWEAQIQTSSDMHTSRAENTLTETSTGPHYSTAQARWTSLSGAMSTGASAFCSSVVRDVCSCDVYFSNFCFAPFCLNHASVFSVISSVSCSSWLLPAQCFYLEYTWNSCILKDISLLSSWCSGGLHKLHFCLCFSIWISFICIYIQSRTKVTYRNRCKSAVSVVCAGFSFSLPCPHIHGFMFCFLNSV